MVTAAPSVRAPPYPLLLPQHLPSSTRKVAIGIPDRMPVPPSMRQREIHRQRATTAPTLQTHSPNKLVQTMTSKKSHRSPPLTAQKLQAATHPPLLDECSKQELETHEKQQSDLVAWRIMTAAHRSTGTRLDRPNFRLQTLLRNEPTAFSNSIWPRECKQGICSSVVYPDCPEMEAEEKDVDGGLCLLQAAEFGRLSREDACGTRALSPSQQKEPRVGRVVSRDECPSQFTTSTFISTPQQRAASPKETIDNPSLSEVQLSERRLSFEPIHSSFRISNDSGAEHNEGRGGTIVRCVCSDTVSDLLKVSETDVSKYDRTLAKHTNLSTSKAVPGSCEQPATLDRSPMRNTSSPTTKKSRELDRISTKAKSNVLEGNQSIEQDNIQCMSKPVSAKTRNPPPIKSDKFEVTLSPHNNEEYKSNKKISKLNYIQEKEFDIVTSQKLRYQGSKSIRHAPTNESDIKSFPITQKTDRHETKSQSVLCKEYKSICDQEEKSIRKKNTILIKTDRNLAMGSAGDTPIRIHGDNSKKRLKDESNRFERNKQSNIIKLPIKFNFENHKMCKTNELDAGTQWPWKGSMKSSILNNSREILTVYVPNKNIPRADSSIKNVQDEQIESIHGPSKQQNEIDAELTSSECASKVKLNNSMQQTLKDKVTLSNTKNGRRNSSGTTEIHVIQHPNNNEKQTHRNYPEDCLREVTFLNFPEKQDLIKDIPSNFKLTRTELYQETESILQKVKENKENKKPITPSQKEVRIHNNIPTSNGKFSNSQEQTSHFNKEEGSKKKSPKCVKQSTNLQAHRDIENTISNCVLSSVKSDVAQEPLLSTQNQKKHPSTSELDTVKSLDPIRIFSQEYQPRTKFTKESFKKSAKRRTIIQNKREVEDIMKLEKDVVGNKWNANEENSDKVGLQWETKCSAVRDTDKMTKDDILRSQRHSHLRTVSPAVTPVHGMLPITTKYVTTIDTSRTSSPQCPTPEFLVTVTTMETMRQVHGATLEGAVGRRSTARRHAASPGARARSDRRSPRDAQACARREQRPAPTPAGGRTTLGALYRRYLRSARAWRPGAKMTCPACGRRARPAQDTNSNSDDAASFVDMCYSGCWSLVHLLREPSPVRLHCRGCGHYLGAYHPRCGRLTPTRPHAPLARHSPLPRHAHAHAHAQQPAHAHSPQRARICARSPLPRDYTLPTRSSGRSKEKARRIATI